MKHPCTKECPDRKMNCRSNCEKYKEFTAFMEMVKKKKQDEWRIDQFLARSAKRNGRR